MKAKEIVYRLENYNYLSDTERMEVYYEVNSLVTNIHIDLNNVMCRDAFKNMCIKHPNCVDNKYENVYSE